MPIYGSAASSAVERRERHGASAFHRLFLATSVSNVGDGISTIAYPWLASAVTRQPVLVALVAVAQRLPWLLFTLPAGVISDRFHRRTLMIAMDAMRFGVTLIVGFIVLARADSLPGPADLGSVEGTDIGLLVLIIVATILLGMSEVLRDNCAQTILPDIVQPVDLERANARLWSAEKVANTFVGPPLASALLLTAFALPFLVNSVTFLVTAALISSLPRMVGRSTRPATRGTFGQDLRDGVLWLRSHELLRTMALMSGIMNGALMLGMSTFVLYAQEVVGVGPLLFTVIGFGGAIGAVVGGLVAPHITKRLGSGPALTLAVAGLALAIGSIGLLPYWPAILLFLAAEAFFGILWDVVVVSLRQSVVPRHLLGRVNSVYRFLAWGMMPVGAAIGGVVVWAAHQIVDRELALRSAWIVAACAHVALIVPVYRRLSSERIASSLDSSSG